MFQREILDPSDEKGVKQLLETIFEYSKKFADPLKRFRSHSLLPTGDRCYDF
jgi:hypothetical protein